MLKVSPLWMASLLGWLRAGDQLWDTQTLDIRAITELIKTPQHSKQALRSQALSVPDSPIHTAPANDHILCTVSNKVATDA